ncbi:Vms1/Ankzf1 family peptidyl-tRNA hydrolase [Actinophytocola glycyrrhizae]|uniref:Vms1/Ankzf1 family peptidyl-tRNA hydrolase n=1 Tax=Actinophytocola glycyrrhizae TaxID=2044873 RepID=A0ABV9S0T1_9PSEU
MNTGELREILAHAGPFATVHLDGSHDTENAAHELELRWRAAREELAEKGADEDTLSAMDNAVRDAPPATGRAGRLLIAAGGEVLLDRALAGPPPAPVTRVGACPYLLPLVELDSGEVPYVAALVDKIGADVRAVDADGVVRTEHSTDGEDHPVHKVRGGGWSHLRMQHNVDETVHRNIRRVAEELARLVDEVGARLLVVAGERQVVAELATELPPRCQEILAEPAGRRENEGADFDRIVTSLAAERARSEQDRVVEEFRAALAADRGLAVQGLAETAAALRSGNAAAVVISDPTLHDAALWTSDEPRSVALSEEELRAVGAEHVDRVRADEALPAAALMVGADLVSAMDMGGDAVPVRDGIGVLLRHRPGATG